MWKIKITISKKLLMNSSLSINSIAESLLVEEGTDECPGWDETTNSLEVIVLVKRASDNLVHVLMENLEKLKHRMPYASDNKYYISIEVSQFVANKLLDEKRPNPNVQS